jgi:CheY-like chemotaxis protein
MAKILVVEDPSEPLKELCAYLEKQGHTVACEPNGRHALKHILQKTPDLVVLDLVTPGMEGCGLLEILRSYLRLQDLPVIVQTPLRSGPLLDRAHALKANAILPKGKAAPKEIADAVRIALTRPKKPGQ